MFANFATPTDRVLIAFLIAGFVLLSAVSLTVASEPTVVRSTDDPVQDADKTLSAEQLAIVKAFESKRVKAINRVIGSVVSIYDVDRQGGGSGVIIDPSGIALTNHHVIVGAGITGWGGLADGKLCRWDLIGTDPGGDVAVIQLQPQVPGTPFPFTPLGDSDSVRVGDWALAMGNPFILTEDQKPTVTLGIVSGIKRYQPGAGDNQLVYGNCIQVDSSINPGNSGGPLFNMDGRVIGINGRGSFKDRGRVNVGLGYAISANQIKNFIPELLATKLVEHATLDVQFEDRDGKVVCSRLSKDAPAAQAGIELYDQLLSFEGVAIKSANQFTNLICTLPEGWPIELVVRKKDGQEKKIVTRALGLPYRKPRPPRPVPDPTPEEKKVIARQMQLVKLLSATPGEIRLHETNRRYAWSVLGQARRELAAARTQLGIRGVDQAQCGFRLRGKLFRSDQDVGEFNLTVGQGGDFRIKWRLDNQIRTLNMEGESITLDSGSGREQIGVEDVLESPFGLYGYGMSKFFSVSPFDFPGTSVIDGSDKTDGRNAWRFLWSMDSGKEFFGWFQMYDEAGLAAARLRKIALDRDCKQGGILFDLPQKMANVLLPVKGYLVVGLEEKPVLRFGITSVERADPIERGDPLERADSIGLSDSEPEGLPK